MRAAVPSGACACVDPVRGLTTPKVDGVFTHAPLIKTTSVFNAARARSADIGTVKEMAYTGRSINNKG